MNLKFSTSWASVPLSACYHCYGVPTSQTIIKLSIDSLKRFKRYICPASCVQGLKPFMLYIVTLGHRACAWRIYMHVLHAYSFLHQCPCTMPCNNVMSDTYAVTMWEIRWVALVTLPPVPPLGHRVLVHAVPVEYYYVVGPIYLGCIKGSNVPQIPGWGSTYRDY